MTKKALLLCLVLCASFVLGAVLFAQQPQQGPPPVNVGKRHGNMRAAQEFIQQAWIKVDSAQQDNNYNLGGHAARAKELLAAASDEIKLSAETANSNQ